MNGQYQKLAAVAEHAVRLGAVASEHIRVGSARKIELTKADGSPVSAADLAVQAVVGLLLQETDPKIPLVAEERADALRLSEHRRLLDSVMDGVGVALERTFTVSEIVDAIDYGGSNTPPTDFWVLDPVDGTEGFLRGGQYSIALAFVEAGLPVAAVLGCPRWPPDRNPVTGIVVRATRGAGAWETHLVASEVPPRRLHCAVSRRKRLTESVDLGHSDHERSRHLIGALGLEDAPLRVESQVKYTLLARGDASVYVRLPVTPSYLDKIWDHAAGALILTEAGGQVTDVDGMDLDFSRGISLLRNRGIVATCGVDQNAVLEALQETSH